MTLRLDVVRPRSIERKVSGRVPGASGGASNPPYSEFLVTRLVLVRHGESNTRVVSGLIGGYRTCNGFVRARTSAG